MPSRSVEGVEPESKPLFCTVLFVTWTFVYASVAAPKPSSMPPPR